MVMGRTEPDAARQGLKNLPEHLSTGMSTRKPRWVCPTLNFGFGWEADLRTPSEMTDFDPKSDGSGVCDVEGDAAASRREHTTMCRMRSSRSLGSRGSRYCSQKL